MIRDQIVFGVEDKKVRERLLREMELTLAGAIKICQASELSQKHVKTFSEMSAVASAQVSDSGWSSVLSAETAHTDRACTAVGGRDDELQALRLTAQA